MLADTDQLPDQINEVVHPLFIVRSQLIAEATSDNPIKLGKEFYYGTLCLLIFNFGHPLSIDLVHQFGQSVHPFVIYIIILFSNKYTIYHIK